MPMLVCVGHVSCGRFFKGTGPRNKYCPRCRKLADARGKAARERIRREQSADVDAARRQEIHRARVAPFRHLFA